MSLPSTIVRAGLLVALAAMGSACAVSPAAGRAHPAGAAAAPGPVAFVATPRGSAVANVVAVPPRGGHPRPVTRGTPSVVEAAWTADGRELVFARRGARRVDVFVAHRGGAPHLIRRCPLSCDPHSFAWSPDGRRIAFVSDIRSRLTGTAGEIAVMNADGSGFHPVCDEAACGQGLDDPRWSPDGSQLLFSNMGTLAFFGLGPLPSRVWIAPPDGSGAHPLTQPHCRPGHPPLRGCAYDSAAAWSPDGRWIAFSRLMLGFRRGHPRAPQTRIELMRPDGSDLHRLARCTGGLCNQIMAPSWAPDGSRIAYIPRVERGPSVVLVRPHGGRMAVRTCAGERCVTPDELAWAPDGTALAFLAGTRTQRVFVMSATGAGLRPVGRGGRCCLAWLPRP